MSKSTVSASQAPSATFKLRVNPNCRRDEIDGWRGDAIRVRCQAPAIDGRANEAVIALLARRLGVRRSDVLLLRGAASRDKVIQVRGLTLDSVHERLGVSARS